MRIKITALVTVVFCASVLFAQSTPATSTQLKSGEVTTQVNVANVVATYPALRAENGQLIAYSNSHGARAVLLDSMGNAGAELNVKIPGATEIGVMDVVLQTDATVLASGWAKNADGEITNFITRIAKDGSQHHITSSFAADHLCSAPNGEVWALGRDKAIAGSATLRPLTISGSTMSLGAPKQLMSDGEKNPGLISLACNGNGVYAYFHRTGQILRFRPKEGSSQKWEALVGATRALSVTGFAVNESGVAFVSLLADIPAGEDHYTTQSSTVYRVTLPAKSDRAAVVALADQNGTPINGDVQVVGALSNDVVLRRFLSGDILRGSFER